MRFYFSILPYRKFNKALGILSNVTTYYVVRKEMHILSLTFTVLNLRKALNALYQRVSTGAVF